MSEPKSIPKLVGVSPDDLRKLIKYLVPNQQEFIELRFDENFKRIKGIKWTDRDVLNYHSCIIKRLRNLAKRDLRMGHQKRKPFLEIVGITREEFLSDLPRYRQDIQDFYQTHFDQELNFINFYDEWTNEEQHYYNEVFLKYVKEAFANSRFGRPLYERVKGTKEMLEIVIPLLSERSQYLIKKYFNSEYKPILNIDWDPEDSLYFQKYTIVRIKEAFNNKAKRFVVEAYKDLLRKIGITRYQFNYLLNELSEPQQNFILANFDSEFRLKSGIDLTADEKIFCVRIIQKLQRKMKEYGFDIINKEYEIKNNYKRINCALQECSSIHYSRIPIDFYFSEIARNDELTPLEKIEAIKSLRNLYEKRKSNIENRLILTRKKD